MSRSTERPAKEGRAGARLHGWLLPMQREAFNLRQAPNMATCRGFFPPYSNPAANTTSKFAGNTRWNTSSTLPLASVGTRLLAAESKASKVAL
jgi:hypothetical protein